MRAAAPADALLAELRRQGVEVFADGELLRWRAPRGALGPADLEVLRSRKHEVSELLTRADGERLVTLRAQQDGSPEELLERFLADAEVPVAVFRSRHLDRDFVLARDTQALEGLTEADDRLPVLFFNDCEKVAGLGARDLEAILDVRQEFGPSAELVFVGPRVG